MAEPVACSDCGAVVDEVPATWSSQVSGRGAAQRRTWLCDRCTRENIRSIEGKLDEAWW